MTDSVAPNALRAARAVRGWSLTDEAQQIVGLGRSRGRDVATVTSLRSQISRWENGHAMPDPMYREILSDLLGRSPADLGIAGVGPAPGGDPAGRLRASFAAAAAVDEEVLRLWHEQLDSTRRLDDELGAVGAGSLVRAQIEQLEETLTHTVDAAARTGVARVLSAAAELAGEQSLDGGEPDEAWRRYERARSAAVEAGDPAAEALAVAGLGSVLVDVGDAGGAVVLLEAHDTGGPEAGGARIAAALAAARADLGDAAAAREAVDRAERLVAAGAAVRVEPSAVPRWRGHVLTRLHDAGAVPVLQAALEARPRAARHRAAVHADLAVALVEVDEPASIEQARAARSLAERIGSTRIIASVKPLTGSR